MLNRYAYTHQYLQMTSSGSTQIYSSNSLQIEQQPQLRQF